MQATQVSIIILGSWNPRIFTPAWIKTNLLGLKETAELQGLINFNDLDFAFRHDGITLVPKYSSVEITVDNFDEKSGCRAAEILIKMLELLPQTPIKAMGVNIRFEIGKKEKLGLINVLNGINGNYGDFKLNQVRQSLKKEKYFLNIVSDISDKNYIVNFNFHYTNITAFDLQFINEHFKETQTILSNGK